jgi:hypothetical protein
MVVVVKAKAAVVMVGEEMVGEGRAHCQAASC